MQHDFSFTLTMGTPEQAAAVLPIIQASLAGIAVFEDDFTPDGKLLPDLQESLNECLEQDYDSESWSPPILDVSGKIISGHRNAWIFEYEEGIGDFCQLIAALHPDYSFKFSADYMDANNVQMNESASLKKGKFEYQYSYFDGESSECERSVCGTIENGKMVFTEEESDSDEGECAFDPEAEYRAFMEELGLME